MRPGNRHAGLLRELPQTARGRMPVHSGAAGVDQERAAYEI
jgi:hypothetical protein